MKRLLIWVPIVLMVAGCIGTSNLAAPNPAAQKGLSLQGTSAPNICPTCPPLVSQTPYVVTVTPTKTIPPTNTIRPTKTATRTITPTPTKTSFPKVYQVHEDAPVYLANVIYLDKGCNWLGIVGQVFGKDGLPVRGALVMVRGTKDGKPVEFITLTGLAQGYKVPNGYEIKIADAVFDSVNEYSIAVYDLKYKPISEPLYFSTFADCGKNMIMVNFKAVQ